MVLVLVLSLSMSRYLCGNVCKRGRRGGGDADDGG
jgi:hypothetical protein